jgi:predicted ATPase/DNA-binding SARP family transcriptional activator
MVGQVNLLGPLEVRDPAGSVVEVSGSPQRLLLARLALVPGAFVSVGSLVDALWPDDAPANATGNLQSYVSRLRRMVGASAVRRTEAGYRLDVEPGATDLGRLDAHLAQLRGGAMTTPSARVEMIGCCLDLWRGEPLAEFAGIGVFDAERTRLAELRVQLCEDRYELRLLLEPARDVLPDLERAVGEHPDRERLTRLLMLALHREGRTADALRVAAEYRHRSIELTGLDPSTALAELEQEMLAGDAPGPPDRSEPQGRPEPQDVADGPRGPVRPPAADVPPRRAPLDRFLGREDELTEVTRHLRDHRLVTVVGPGGVGKTRLVLELLDRRQASPAGVDGAVHVAELAGVLDDSDVAAAVADAVGLRSAPAGHETALTDALAAGDRLVVLDNCEHVVSGVQTLADRLLSSCPRLVLLATSRRSLGVPGEQVVRLGPLGVDEQVELFCDRAVRARSGFLASPAERSLIEQICSRVEGLPLAVELAARRESVFGLRQLLVRLCQDLDVIEPAEDGTWRGVRATIDWSRQLLTESTRTVFDRLSVCRDGFGIEAVEHLAPPGVDATTALAELIDASLVLADVDADPPRYRLLETTRQVGWSNLSDAQRADAHRAHARWGLEVADVLRSHHAERAKATTDLLRREGANLQSAMVWSLEAGDHRVAAEIGLALALAVALGPHLSLLEALRGVAPSVEHAPAVDPLDGALLQTVSGSAEWLVGNTTRAELLLNAALAEIPSDHPHRSTGLYFRSMTKLFQGEMAAVEDDVTELLAVTANDWMRVEAVCVAAMANLFAGRQEVAERWMSDNAPLLESMLDVDGVILYTKGELASAADPEVALGHFAAAARLAEQRGHAYHHEIARIGRTAVLIRLGRHDEAVPECASLLERLHSLGMWPQAWTALRLTAELLVAVGDPRAAAVILAAAEHDALAPAVVGPDEDRLAELWTSIGEACGSDGVAAARRRGDRDGRMGALACALEALGRLTVP